MNMILKHPVYTILIIAAAGFVGIHLFYYEHARSPEILAEKLIEEGRGAEDCFLFRTFDIGPRPTTYEMQMRCVYTYAKLTQDPTACELLLPSDYGWSCLGAVEEKLFLGDPCYYSSTKDSLYCNKDFSEGELTIEHPQMEDCSAYLRKDLQEWCHFERTLRMEDIYECDVISHRVVYDNCQYNYAFKNRDAKSCSQIKDTQRKEFCEFRIGMMLKYQ